MSERKIFGRLRSFINPSNGESIQQPLTWRSVIEEKLSQTEVSPAKFTYTIGDTNIGYYITIVKKNDDCNVVLFELRLPSSTTTSAVVVKDGDEPRLLFDFGNDDWAVLPRGVESEENMYGDLEYLKKAKTYNPQKLRWHGRSPDVDEVVKAYLFS